MGIPIPSPPTHISPQSSVSLSFQYLLSVCCVQVLRWAFERHPGLLESRGESDISNTRETGPDGPLKDPLEVGYREETGASADIQKLMAIADSWQIKRRKEGRGHKMVQVGTGVTDI